MEAALAAPSSSLHNFALAVNLWNSIAYIIYDSGEVWVIAHVQQINILALGVLQWVLILHTRYVTCCCALMCWYLEHKQTQVISTIDQ